MTTEENPNAMMSRQRVIRVGSALAAVVLATGAFFVLSGPSDAESVKVVCAMRTTTDEPIIDTSKSNTREDLARGLRERARILDDAAGKTGGDIKDALERYASVMSGMAEAIEDDNTGASLAEVVQEMSTNEELASADRTLTGILDSEC